MGKYDAATLDAKAGAPTNTNTAPEDTNLAALVDSAVHAYGLAYDGPRKRRGWW